jgi:photosystem II stability/assembly factor-like uncharacterized protein
MKRLLFGLLLVLLNAPVGAQWTQLGGGGNGWQGELFGNIVHGDTMLIQDNNGSRRTTDHGATWVKLSNTDSVPYVFAFYRAGNFLLAGTRGAIYRSGDFGLTWAKVATLSGIDSNSTIIVGFGAGYSHFLARTDQGMILRSDSSCQTWVPLTKDSLLVGPGWNNHGGQWTEMIPFGGRILALGNSTFGNLIESPDEGMTWQVIAGISGIGDESFCTVGNKICVLSSTSSPSTSPSTLYVSSDSGKKWDTISLDSLGTYCYSLTTDGHYIFCLSQTPNSSSGTVDGTLYRSQDFGNSWVKIDSTLVVGTTIDYSFSEVVLDQKRVHIFVWEAYDGIVTCFWAPLYDITIDSISPPSVIPGDSIHIHYSVNHVVIPFDSSNVFTLQLLDGEHIFNIGSAYGMSN